MMNFKYSRLNTSQIQVINNFDLYTVQHVLSFFHGIQDIVVVVLEYAEVKPVIFVHYQREGSSVSDEYIFRPISRCFINQYMENLITEVHYDYLDAEKEFGNGWVETNFFQPYYILKAYLEELQHHLKSTYEVTYIEDYESAHPKVYVGTDEYNFSFHRYLDVFSDVELDVIPDL